MQDYDHWDYAETDRELVRDIAAHCVDVPEVPAELLAELEAEHAAQ